MNDAWAATARGELADDVRRGLAASPKSLPSRWFYDDVGSALFEVITLLPEYYLTRCEQEILDAHAAEIVAGLPDDVAVVELGSGSGRKTRTILRALLASRKRLAYRPIDISAAALEAAEAPLLQEFPTLAYEPVVARYRAGLAGLADDPRPKLVLFIGSSLGNFRPDEAGAFLRAVASPLGPRDRVLLGTDLAKDPSIVLPAYDDPIGVTAAFNLNLLARLNRELGADFDPRRFRHETEYVDDCIESWLVSVGAQEVRVRDLGLAVRLEDGERIHTETSAKFTEARLARILEEAGIERERTWTDAKGWFSFHRLRRADP